LDWKCSMEPFLLVFFDSGLRFRIVDSGVEVK